MKLFLDTADRNAWQEFLSLGLFYGVTTNPIILEKAGINLRHLKNGAWDAPYACSSN
jgi:transaldolase